MANTQTLNELPHFGKKVFLIDAAYVDATAGELSRHFSQVLQREIAKVDLMTMLDSLALDAGFREGNHEYQVIFLHPSHFQFTNCLPRNPQKELAGMAFKDALGEFAMEAYEVKEDMSTLGIFMAETLQLLVNDASVEDIIMVGALDATREMLEETIRSNKKRLTLFSMAPQEFPTAQTQIVGFALLHAMQIRADELQGMA